MKTIVTESLIKSAMKSKFPSRRTTLSNLEIKYDFTAKKCCDDPYEVTKVQHEIVSVKEGINVKQFNISSLLSIARTTSDHDLKQDKGNVTKLHISPEQETQFPTEVLLKLDHDTIHTMQKEQ